MQICAPTPNLIRSDFQVDWGDHTSKLISKYANLLAHVLQKLLYYNSPNWFGFKLLKQKKGYKKSATNPKIICDDESNSMTSAHSMLLSARYTLHLYILNKSDCQNIKKF